MATNTGIEVTALRPAAQAGDFYVRPEQSNSGIQQGLERLAGVNHKKQTEEDKATAERMFLEDSLDYTNVEAIRNFDAYAHLSPAVQLRVAELRGNSVGVQWSNESNDAYNTWLPTSKGDGSDFNDFAQTQRRNLIEKLGDNKYMISGALSVLNETEHNLRSRHRQQLDARIREEAIQGMDVKVGSIVNSFALNTIDGKTALAQIEENIADTVGTGVVSRGETTKRVFDALLTEYVNGNLGEKALLLAQSSVYATGPGGTKVTNTQAKAAINTAIVQRSNRLDALEAKRAGVAEASRKQYKVDASLLMNTQLGANANHDWTDEELGIFAKAGINMTTIHEQQAAWIHRKSFTVTEPQTVAANKMRQVLEKNYGNPNFDLEHEFEMLDLAVRSGKVHPDQLTALTEVITSIDRSKSHLHSGPIKTGMDYELKMLEMQYDVLPAGYGGAVNDFTAAYKRAAGVQIANFYTEQGRGPNKTELDVIQKSVLVQTKPILDKMHQSAGTDYAWRNSIKKAVNASKEDYTGEGFWNLEEDSISMAVMREFLEGNPNLASQLEEDPLMFIQRTVDGKLIDTTPLEVLTESFHDNAGTLYILKQVQPDWWYNK